MRSIAANLDPDLFGEIVNLIGGPAMSPTQRCQTEWLAGLTDANVEPPSEVPVVCLCRPVVEGQPDDLLLDVGEASVRQPLLCEIAVQAYRTAEAIHGVHKFVCPLYDVGIPW